MNRKKQLLIVEDEALLARAITRYLQLSGYQTETFADGAVAWERLKEKRFDTLVTDRWISPMGGEMLAEWGLRHDRLRRVVVISGDNPDKVTIRGAPGTVSYLQKPFDLNELLKLVKKNDDVAAAVGKINQ